MILDSELKSLEVVLNGSVSANELPITVVFSTTINQLSKVSKNIKTNNSTAVTVVPKPTNNQQYNIEEIIIHNSDNASATVTIQINDGTNLWIQISKSLTSGQTLIYNQFGFEII